MPTIAQTNVLANLPIVESDHSLRERDELLREIHPRKFTWCDPGIVSMLAAEAHLT